MATTSNTVEACAQGALWQQALQLLRAEESPNDITYAGVMLALVRCGLTAKARLLARP